MGIKSVFFILIIRRVTGSVACSFSFVVLFFLTDDRVGVCLRPLKPKEKDPGDVQSCSFSTPIRRMEVYPGPE